MKLINYKNIAFGVIIFFSIIGISVFAVTIHELSHLHDYKDYAQEGEICVLNFPTTIDGMFNAPMGYYKFKHSTDEKTVEGVEAINKHTETRAYAYTAVIFIIFGVMLFIVLCNKMDEKFKARKFEEMFEEKWKTISKEKNE